MTQFRNLEKEDDRLLVDARRMREEYLKNFNAFREQLRQRAGTMHIDYHLLRPMNRSIGARGSICRDDNEFINEFALRFVCSRRAADHSSAQSPPFRYGRLGSDEFLHISQKTRRRFFLENYLLMLMRMAIIAIFVARCRA